MNYEGLERIYNLARNVCDPVDYIQRQKALLYAVTEYLLEKDKPEEEKDDSNSS